ncbi:MAG: ATP synthase subunit I [Selenomonadaceae bacterium]
MKEILVAYCRQVLVQIGICTAGIGVLLYTINKTHLFAAFLIGCFLAIVCWWTLVYRIWKSSTMSINRAKRQMQFGLGLRIFMVFVVLRVAIYISMDVFWTVVGGFFLLAGLLMVNVVVFAYNNNAGKKIKNWE